MWRTKDEWERIVAQYRTSDLSYRQFSAKKEISKQSLRSWARKLDARSSLSAKAAEGFIEIAAVPNKIKSLDGNNRGGTADGLVIRLGNGRHIEVKPETDRVLLA